MVVMMMVPFIGYQKGMYMEYDYIYLFKFLQKEAIKYTNISTKQCTASTSFLTNLLLLSVIDEFMNGECANIK